MIYKQFQFFNVEWEFKDILEDMRTEFYQVVITLSHYLL